MAELWLRQGTRALLIDHDDRLLLVKYIFPSGAIRWGTPGGGLDDGEDHTTGLRRELDEELGLTEVEIGPVIWHSTHVFPMLSGHDGQRNVFHLVRVPTFDPAPRIGWEQLRAEFVHDLRWWTLDEIDASDEIFTPSRLGEFTRKLLRVGPPAEPIDVSEPT